MSAKKQCDAVTFIKALEIGTIKDGMVARVPYEDLAKIKDVIKSYKYTLIKSEYPPSHSYDGYSERWNKHTYLSSPKSRRGISTVTLTARCPFGKWFGIAVFRKLEKDDSFPLVKREFKIK